MTTRFEQPPETDGAVCTPLKVPYRFMVAVDRDRLPEVADLPIDEIVMATENGKVRKALVTTYPAA